MNVKVKKQLFAITWLYNVCPWQAFPASSNVSGQEHKNTEESSISNVFNTGRFWPHLQTLDKSENAYQEQTW
jgi:hypothetical protein